MGKILTHIHVATFLREFVRKYDCFLADPMVSDGEELNITKIFRARCLI